MKGVLVLFFLVSASFLSLAESQRPLRENGTPASLDVDATTGVSEKGRRPGSLARQSNYACGVITPTDLEAALNLTVTDVKQAKEVDICNVNVASEDIYSLSVWVMDLWAMGLIESNPELARALPKNRIPDLGRVAYWHNDKILVETFSGHQIHVSISAKGPKVSDRVKKGIVSLLQKAVPALDSQVASKAVDKLPARISGIKEKNAASSCLLVPLTDLEHLLSVRVTDIDFQEKEGINLCQFALLSPTVRWVSIDMMPELDSDMWDIVKSSVPDLTLDGKVGQKRTENVKNLGKAAYWTIGKKSLGLVVWTHKKSIVEVEVGMVSGLATSERAKLLALVRSVLERQR